MTLDSRTDMKPSEILYRLRMKRTSYAEIDRNYELPEGTAKNTARRPHIVGERALSETLGVPPQNIWPSRYDASTGERLYPQPMSNYRTQPILGPRQNVTPEMTCGAAA
ncbi:helix-turn-helix domain-containing protein [Pseudovibrio ascidiaceicola]|uniref:helix-turn-helix domain-containing protein n=1 Tax=Pseudovibrio ascidiaceicola TaxID=285279 RepID=UPI003D35A95A